MEEQRERSPSSIYDITERCRDAFGDCTFAPQLMQEQWAENRLADFNLWAAGVGASTHGPACLDSRLSSDELARDIVLSLLFSLNAHLDECIRLASGKDALTPRGASSSSETLEDSDKIDDDHMTLEETMDGTEDLLQELIRIGGAIRRAGKKSRLRNADESFNPDDYQDFRQHMIQVLLALPSVIERDRSSCTNGGRNDVKLDFTTDRLSPVQEHLINANLRRRHRFIRARRHGKKLAVHRLQAPPAVQTGCARRAATESGAKVAVEVIGLSDAATPDQKKSDQVGGDAARLTTGAGTSVNTKFSEFSQIQLPTPTTRSQKAVSQALSSTATKVEYPPKPSHSTKPGLQSFKCPCCWESLSSMMSNTQWKKHLTEDLCPYTCIFPECGTTPMLFATQKEWRTHLLEDHRGPPYWKCFACRHSPVTFPAGELLLAHIKESHSEAMPENQLSMLVDICQQRDPPAFQKCPLCSWADEEVLRDHMLKEHGATTEANEPIYWECLACRERQAFDDHDDLDKHKKDFHGDDAVSDTQLQAYQRLECAPCRAPAFFADEDELREHLVQLHPGIDDEERLPEFVDMCGIGAGVAVLRPCPFCRRPGGDAGTGAEGPIQQAPDQSTLLGHIAQHVHSFSLHALPWATERSEDGAATKQHPMEQFDEGEYFADAGEASNCAQMDGQAGNGNGAYDIRNHMRVALAQITEAPAVDLQFYVKDVNSYDEHHRAALFSCAESGRESDMKLLVDLGAFLDQRDDQQRTPLLVASQHGHREVVELLLHTGHVNVEVMDMHGRTPLMQAAIGGYEAVVRLLLERGADIEAKNKYGRTPLILAAKEGYEAVVRLLLERGADIEAKDRYSWTPLILAATGGHEAVVKLLLERGADIEAKDRNGWTPLIQAAKGGYEAVVRLLLERGADIEAKDRDGWTPLIQAATGGHKAVVRLLLERGANIEAKDRDGWTPLMRAATGGHEAVVRLLQPES